MSQFTNNPVDLEAIPALSREAFTPVHENYLRVSLLGLGLSALIAVVIGTVVAIVVSENSWVPLVVAFGVVVLLGLTAVAKIFEVRNIAFQVRDNDISYRSGIFVRTVATVPFSRVQHARLRQGPIQRRFGLATIEVSSAGPDLRIEGVGHDEAEKVKALVLERAGATDEER